MLLPGVSVFKVIKPNESVQAGTRDTVSPLGTSEESWCCNLEEKQKRLNCDKTNHGNQD